ncbi:MAG: hypothetical protein KAR20_09825 [Candidatus Heimdallarchaeota archaeon]|nr:hypothetical protein [Candidatus Heimdallarchaeota archaeon]
MWTKNHTKMADLTEVDFSRTYPTDWIYNRPFYTELIEDWEPVHKPLSRLIDLSGNILSE